MELVKLEKLIDEVTAKYPLNSQEGKGLDTFVSFKLYHPDRRNNPEGFWYVTEASRVGDDVQFAGLSGTGFIGGLGARIEPNLFTLSGLMNINNGMGREIAIDNDFKPGTVRELYDAERNLQPYIDNEIEKQRRALILASRDDVCEMISGYFLALDADMGDIAHKIGESLADEVTSCMMSNKGVERRPALLRVIAYRLGLISARKLQGW